MSASFGKEIASKLKETQAVWSVDAMYKDVSGSATMTEAETKVVTKILSDAGKKFNTIQRSTFTGISENDELNVRVKAFINSKIRQGEKIRNTSRFVDDLMNYVYNHYQKEIDKVKSEKAKEVKEAKRKEIMSYFSNTPKTQIVALFDLYNLIIEAKEYIIKKLDKAKRVGTFLKTANGFKVTEQEGFVAIDHMGKNAIKLVDRLGFSQANFSPDIIKGWQR